MFRGVGRVGAPKESGLGRPGSRAPDVGVDPARSEGAYPWLQVTLRDPLTRLISSHSGEVP